MAASKMFPWVKRQEERDRAERAEDQLDQLTRSLAQEKSTSTALQAERAALERLQVLCPIGQTAPCIADSRISVATATSSP
jgi:porphobilinogen deaminase